MDDHHSEFIKKLLMKNNRKHFHDGFTLTELMVGMGVLAIVMVLSLDVILLKGNAEKSSSGRHNDMTNYMTVLDRLKKDLHHAVTLTKISDTQFNLIIDYQSAAGVTEQTISWSFDAAGTACGGITCLTRTDFNGNVLRFLNVADFEWCFNGFGSNALGPCDNIAAKGTKNYPTISISASNQPYDDHALLVYFLIISNPTLTNKEQFIITRVMYTGNYNRALGLVY
jgi:prepilin-type N-terminal cleavage/methylation domain-containing protein